MYALLWLVPVLPFTGSIVLALAGRGLSKRQIGAIGAGSVGISAALVLLLAAQFIAAPPDGNAYTQYLWTWISVGGFTAATALKLDALSLVMAAVVTFVGFLIHLYSIEFMAEDDGYRRFFAYMNLFVGSMLTLVLADNLLLLYLGWEGVGLCSYLLIGFWYKDPYNGYAARKAFIVTRAGDTALIIGLLLLFTSLGTLNIHELMNRAAAQWMPESRLAIAASLLLLIGAIGKSAQLPLQVWLPDAMAGPTPVSALIHAATMVTAGVYLIARTHTLFELSPFVMSLVAALGAATLLISAFSALVQKDIKRVLAYSTISQVGYMFLGLGVGAWGAAVFHLVTHAFFKALLFLCAGVVIKSLDGEHDLSRMGGLRKEMPVAFWTFLIGAASLSALPLFTAGYYSKELILDSVWASRSGVPLLWMAGIAGALLTALYAFRVVFIVFFGQRKKTAVRRPGAVMKAPLFILAALSVGAGFIEVPGWLGDLDMFTGFMGQVLPSMKVTTISESNELVPGAAAALAPVAGVFLAYVVFLRRTQISRYLAETKAGGAVRHLWFSGWGLDRIYDRLLVRPFLGMAAFNKNDFLDYPYAVTAWTVKAGNRLIVQTQSGKVRWYAAGMATGAVLALSAIFFL